MWNLSSRAITGGRLITPPSSEPADARTGTTEGKGLTESRIFRRNQWHAGEGEKWHRRRMPRLDRMGLDERTLGVLASLPVPITLAESLLSRDSEQLALECGVSLRAVNKLRYLVALRCQPQPPVPDRRVSEGHNRAAREEGHEGDGDGGTSMDPTTPSTATERRRGGRDAGEGESEGHGKGRESGPRASSFASADSLYLQAKEVGGFVTTGSDSLDSLLCKGLMLHHVVEVIGRSSAGKTQLCLTAAVAAASHGIGVLYVDTANGCNVRRMQQIARSRYADANGEMSTRQMDGLLDRLRVVRAFDISKVLSTLVEYIDGVTDGGRDGVYSECRLVILDSVTAVVSPLLGGAKNPAGHGLMASLGHILNRAASQCSACILVANSTVVSRETMSEEEGPRAALGMTWEGVPSIRVMLTEDSKTGSGRNTSEGGGSGGTAEAGSNVSVRTAKLLKHPAQACGNSITFVIGDGGVTDAQD